MPLYLTRKRSIGMNLIYPKRTNTSGTASHSEAFARRGVRVAVSLRFSVLRTCVLTNTLALYEADRAAHEEAVRNGGVCLVVFRTYHRLTFFFSLRSLSCTGTGFPTRRRVSTSLPACGNLVPTRSLPTRAHPTYARCALRQHPTRSMNSSAGRSAKQQVRVALKCCYTIAIIQRDKWAAVTGSRLFSFVVVITPAYLSCIITLHSVVGRIYHCAQFTLHHIAIGGLLILIYHFWLFLVKTRAATESRSICDLVIAFTRYTVINVRPLTAPPRIR